MFLLKGSEQTNQPRRFVSSIAAVAAASCGGGVHFAGFQQLRAPKTGSAGRPALMRCPKRQYAYD
ncbi:hypothetical protein NECAME_06338 [Necator americanus]|uniref:Uncharacterized protein n=1 Tax=Necator americanus TaxID=51031 RepID=W2TVE8_NECAM|nr:hypothetical protein NECAME_06338 [Necator americanus]ETN85634.1 hypothetical protein NECAME_06338 [Necator americanus]